MDDLTKLLEAIKADILTESNALGYGATEEDWFEHVGENVFDALGEIRHPMLTSSHLLNIEPSSNT